jgi:hypothetical protein
MTIRDVKAGSPWSRRAIFDKGTAGLGQEEMVAPAGCPGGVAWCPTGRIGLGPELYGIPVIPAGAGAVLLLILLSR